MRALQYRGFKTEKRPHDARRAEPERWGATPSARDMDQKAVRDEVVTLAERQQERPKKKQAEKHSAPYNCSTSTPSTFTYSASTTKTPAHSARNNRGSFRPPPVHLPISRWPTSLSLVNPDEAVTQC